MLHLFVLAFTSERERYAEPLKCYLPHPLPRRFRIAVSRFAHHGKMSKHTNNSSATVRLSVSGDDENRTRVVFLDREVPSNGPRHHLTFTFSLSHFKNPCVMAIRSLWLLVGAASWLSKDTVVGYSS
jgi:hypothetical protein